MINRDNYIEINDLETLQKGLIYLMGELHTICEDNGLVYNLFGGTMLGAVRHNGMIPWDDDIDITMPRDDYEKFIKLVNEKYSEKFDVYAFPRDGYCYPFAKFTLKGSLLIEDVREQYQHLGLYVDVFPVDGYPTNNEKGYFNKLRILKKLRCRCVYKEKHDSGFFGDVMYGMKVLYTKVCELLGVDFYIKNEIALAKKYDFNDSEYVLCQGAGWNEKGKLKKTIYLDRKLYPYNGHLFWGISDYHEHLTRLYGDYMKLPPEDGRISNHNYELYIEKKVFVKMKGELR